jgi:hypothetical protein
LKEVDRTGVDFPPTVKLVVSFDHFQGPRASLLDQALKLLEKSPEPPRNSAAPDKPQQKIPEKPATSKKTPPEKPAKSPIGIQVYIAPDNFPEKILKKNRVEIIEQWVIKQILAIKSEKKPVFLGRKYDKAKGVLLVTCKDLDTKLWLLEHLNGKCLWEGTRLKVGEF